jgi:peptidyl-dipeptidase A
MKRGALFLVLVLIASTLCVETEDADAEFADFVGKHVAGMEPLFENSSTAYWNACLTGRDEDYQRSADIQLEIKKIYSSREDFEYVREVKDKLRDPLLRRQAEILYMSYLPNQIPEDILQQITEKSTGLEQKFNTFRGTMDGREVTMNEINDILSGSKDSGMRKKAWEAQKQAGQAVSADLIELVRLRNEAARLVGFDNYFELSLEMQELREDELVSILSELDSLTSEPFREIKDLIDGELKKKYGVSRIMPWHYSDPFFQEVPRFYDTDLDGLYRGRDVLEIGRDFYSEMGFDLTPILENSSLYEAPGKYPHAYTIDMDRRGDVRVMMNVRNNSYWMGTTLHESGHAVYAKNIDPDLPFLLRDAAHTLTTEGIALFFERMTYKPEWLETHVGAELDTEDEEELSLLLRAKELIFARWVLVMFNFEREMYRNPDQDLNRLWWSLVRKYQMIDYSRDMPDYASKIHLVSSPVYYHNYLLGELFASQLEKTTGGEISRETGDLLRDEVFAPGAKHRWDELVEMVTGEPLSAKAFAEQFC